MNKTISVLDAQEKEAQLEEAIWKAIGAFERETGVSVVAIKVERIDVSSMGGSNKTILQEVKVQSLL